MSALAVVIIVVAVLVIALAVAGFVANRRRARSDEPALEHDLEAANRALADAYAQDRGWEPERLEAAAREAFASRSDDEVRELHLVEVADRPGTEDDEAIFAVITADGRSEYVHLARRGDAWITPAV